MHVGQEVAEYICTTPFDDFPKDVVEKAKFCIIDSIGVALYGSRFEAAQILLSLAKEIGGREESTILGSTLKVPASFAALANGVSLHVAEYDDYMFWMQGHPSAVIMPTSLALCEALGTSGKTLLSAFILGTEVGGKLGKVMKGSHYEAGWHGTGTIGTIAAAAAAARAFNLSREQTTNALAIAASSAAGLRENFGTMTKSYHVGQAARNGILAAQLAKKGFTASPNIFEGPSGFFNTFSGTGDPASLPKELGEPYALKNVAFKKYPSCAGTHTAVDAIFDLKERVVFKPEEVEEIECRVRPVLPSVLIHPDPQNELEAKFSMQFCVSAALVFGQLGIAQFDTKLIRSPQIQKVMKKVRMVSDPALEKLSSEMNVLAPIELTLKLTNGKQYVKKVVEAKGGSSNPMEHHELESKFVECASWLLSPSQSKAVLEMLLRIETLEKLSDLIEAFYP